MQGCRLLLGRFRGGAGIEYGHPRASDSRKAIRCPHGTEFSHRCPILSHIVPNSRSPVTVVSPNWPKIAIPVPYCPILSHPVFSHCLWSTYGQGLRPKTTSAPSLANAIFEHIYGIIIQQRRRGWQGRRLTPGAIASYLSAHKIGLMSVDMGEGVAVPPSVPGARVDGGLDSRPRFREGDVLWRERRLIGPPAFKTLLPWSQKKLLTFLASRTVWSRTTLR